jgi:hypothetical protein
MIQYCGRCAFYGVVQLQAPANFVICELKMNAVHQVLALLLAVGVLLVTVTVHWDSGDHTVEIVALGSGVQHNSSKVHHSSRLHLNQSERIVNLVLPSHAAGFENRRHLITFNHSTDATTAPQLTANPVALIKCNNQTRCIQPVLQLRKTYNVYYCKKVSHGVRFYFLIREGLLQHPKINLVSTPEAAEVIVYLPESAAWQKSECNKPEYFNRLLVLDEGDGPQLFESDSAHSQLLMFKRSYVRRHNGIFQSYMGYVKRTDVLPMSYTIADAYVSPTFYTQAQRDIEILCTLRPSKVRCHRLPCYLKLSSRLRVFWRYTFL